MNITEEIYIAIPEYSLLNIVILDKLINIINISDMYNPLIYFTYAPPFLLFSFPLFYHLREAICCMILVVYCIHDQLT